MKFRGQIKVPDVDHPAVGAMADVEGSHLELYLTEGESLGRWSLVDVRADRLISNAFSLRLGDEEVTFLADDPIDFAYRGVEHMANEWARYRAMTLPRRLVATGRSRKDARPSRIDELRGAMIENLTGSSLTAIPKTPESGQSAHTLPGVGSAVSRDAVTPSPVSRSPQPEVVEEEMPAISALPTVNEEAAADQDTDQPVPTSSEPTGREESVFKDAVPWAKAAEANDEVEELRAEVERLRAEAEARRIEAEERQAESGRHLEPTPPVAEPKPAVPVLEDTVGPLVDSETPIASDEDDAAAPAPWMAPETAIPDADVEAPEGEEPEEAPEPMVAEAITEPVEDEAESPEEDAATSSFADPDEHERYIVDLGAFEEEGKDDDSAGEPPSRPDPDREPALAAANGKGGLMGAVRSAFVRNKAAHDHEFVEAPGGIGITRQICTECGHISIGVADSE